jgi:hypothetical protein
MRKVFGIAPLLVAALSLGSYAQAPPTPRPDPPNRATPPVIVEPASQCPRVELQTQNGQNVRDGQPVMFVANISGGDPNVTPTIVWNVSAGSIKDGQGTRKIEVDSTGAGIDRKIVADLWIGGYSSECSSQAVATVRVIGHAAKVDEFGDLDPEKENERLASVVAATAQSNDNIFVIAYAGRTNVRGYALTAIKRIRTQLSASGLPAQRLGAIDGGFREEPIYEIWVVPEGADQPRATPTVDRKEIVFPSTTPARTTPVKTAPVKKP